MNQTSHSLAATQPARSSAGEANPGREMPLLFQLADANRISAAMRGPQPATNHSSDTRTAADIPAGPGPLAMSPLPGTFPPASTPLASTAPKAWTPPPAGLFDAPSGFSTAGLLAGETPEWLKATESTKPAPTPVSSKAELPAAESKTVASAEETELTTSTLPKVIDAAVKIPESAPDSSPPDNSATDTSATDSAPALAEATSLTSATKSESAASSLEVSSSSVKEPAEHALVEAGTTDKPSPASLRRQRTAARQQKAASSSGDWLQSHGKVIAIGFVIALVGTIYLARRNSSRPAPEPTNEPVGLAIEVPGEHAGDERNEREHNHDKNPSEEANTAPRLVEAPALPHDATPSPATHEPTTTNPAANPAHATADLHAPLPAPSSTSPPANAAPLFPWQSDTRTATRPEPVGNVTPATSTTPLSTPNANSPPNGPVLNAPTYPETNLRDAPLLPPAPATAPPVPAAPSGGQPAGGQGSGRAPSRSYPASFTSAPGGTRYERTGSGLY